VAISDANTPNNVYDVIKLDQPVQDPAELDELLTSIAEAKFQRNGKFKGIVEFMKSLAESIESEWENVSRKYYLQNLNPSQFYATFMRKDDDGNDIYLAPKVLPFEADIDHVLESEDITPDSPMNEIEKFILFDITRNSPASLTRRAFGTRKELSPRFRFWIQMEDIQYPVLAQRKEFIITFKTFAHSTEEAYLMSEALEYYLNIKKEILYEFGAQKFYTIGTDKSTSTEKATKMPYREFDFYLRAEQWYIGEGAHIIDKIDMDWYLPDLVSSGEATIERQENDNS